MADKTERAVIVGQGSFDQTCLIFERLAPLASPGWCPPVSKEIYSDEVEPIFQIAHQSAPLSGTGHAALTVREF